jgi:prepilin-type processing-associated H-X9-DG protein
MQPPQDKNYAPPPPVYTIPHRSSSFPLWGKFLIGCGLLLIIVIVLAGIGLSRAMVGNRALIQTSLCTANLRNAQRGMELYSQDYDQSLPRAATWMDDVIPYVKNRTDLKCPVVRLADPKGFGYAFNSKLSGIKTAKITTPLTTVEVYDSTDIERNASDAVTTLPTPPRHNVPRDRGAGKTPKRFNIVLYADGHVRFLSEDGSTVDAEANNMRRKLFGPRRKTQ